MKLLDSFYKRGTSGSYNLWGDGDSMDSSRKLEYGWEHDPSDPSGYATYVFGFGDEDDFKSKASFVQAWMECKEEADL